MDAMTSPSVTNFNDDGSLGGVLAELEPHDDKSLVIEYGGRTIQSGYHVTEVKAGSFVTLDCGGNPDQWHETILQVEDIPSQDGREFMKVEKFRKILAQVATKIELEAGARLTFEVGVPGTPMQVFDVHALEIDGERALLRLAPRPAICKPRHRAAQVANAVSCCASPVKSGCCA
ncbi:hypothetical protein FHS21_003693 [Phyllobacterium trifolii]|uniref:Uncharacterized protein n=1 Tax=Phyllobacterium trifolii TaxID=300193 RepID=A0A839U9R6_9HYPH|nr:DUF6428 family protein [Phyllobacterium trifolii]MBB3147277.1 hypothetical protein [Phyllobacterium trifolii]